MLLLRRAGYCDDILGWIAALRIAFTAGWGRPAQVVAVNNGTKLVYSDHAAQLG